MANFSVCTQWFKTDDATQYLQLCSALRHGDIIEGKYPDNTETWAICTDTSPEPLVVQRQTKDMTVQRKKLLDLGKGGKLRIKNSKDSLKSPKTVDDIIRSTLEAVGHEARNGPMHPSTTTVNVQRRFAESMRYTEQEVKVRLGKYNLSNWHRKDDLPMFNRLLREGDIVQFMESGNIRWAICIAIDPQPMVVHRKDGSQIGHWSVLREALTDFIGEGQVRINNARDNVSNPKDVSDILQSALEATGKVGSGCWQCEQNGAHDNHFVESMRYSKQDIKSRLDNNNTSQWYREDKLPVFNWLLRQGDIVQFKKSENIGWGICTKTSLQPTVVHLKDGSQPGHWSVVKMTLADLVEDGLVRINNARDNVSKPKHASHIIRSVLSVVGKHGVRKLGQCDPNGVYGSHFVESMRYSEQDIKSRLNKNSLSEWYEEYELATFNWLLREGDIVQIRESVNIRWAICTEIGYQPMVVYRKDGSQPGDWSVALEDLCNLVGGGQVRINNSRDNVSKPKDLSDILSALKAVKKIGDGVSQGDQSGGPGSHFVESMRYSEQDKERQLDNNNLSQWHGEDELLMFNRLLRNGDIVQFRNSKNIWWAICIEIGLEPMVVHREAISETGHWSVVKEVLSDSVRGGQVRINNARDKLSKPKDVSGILQSALEAVGNDGWYGHDSHFVESMRYSERDIKSRLSENKHGIYYSKEELPMFYWLLRRGDIVYMYRSSIGHYAICVEEPHTDQGSPSLVLPAFVLEEMSDMGKQSDTMVSCNFDVFRKDVMFRISNDWDKVYLVRSVEDILKMAYFEIGKTVSLRGSRTKTCLKFVKRVRYTE